MNTEPTLQDPGFEYLSNTFARIEQEKAMRSRWRGRRLMPNSLEDEAQHEAGQAAVFVDLECEVLFLVGSDPQKAESRQIPLADLDTGA